MKLNVTIYEDHTEVEVMDGCLRLHSYTFKTEPEARAFCSGFSCCQQVANSLIQSIPNSYTKKTA